MSAENQITESRLADLSKFDAVTNIRVQETEKGTFTVLVRLTAEEHERTITTVRKTAREWVSLERLIAHLRLKYGSAPNEVTLCKQT